MDSGRMGYERGSVGCCFTPPIKESFLMPLDGATTTMPSNTSITDRAMLARLSITKWSASKKEKRVIQEVADNHGNAVDMVRVTKSLLAKEALAKIATVSSAAREYHYEQTLPWLQDGARILPSDNFFVYSEKMRELKSEFDASVEEFTAGYPDFVRAARDKLGDLFEASEYPRADQVASAFSFEVGFDKIPEGRDFRVQLGDDQVSAIRNDIESRIGVATEQAMASLWARIFETVSHISEKLHTYKPSVKGSKKDGIEAEKVENAFRDSLIENLRNLCEILPRLNVTGSAELSAMTKRLQAELCTEDADVLRKNDTVRTDVAAKADAILQEVQAFLA